MLARSVHLDNQQASLTRIGKISFVYRGHVPSKSNHRHSKWDTSRAEWRRIKEYETDIAALATSEGSMRHYGTGRVNIRMVAYSQRIDLDNICKSTLDGMRKVVYHDDSSTYIREVCIRDGSKQSKDKSPRLKVTVEWVKEGK